MQFRKIISKIFGNELLRKGISDTVYFTVAQAGSRLISLLIIPLLLNIISVEEFAKYDIFLLSSSMMLALIVLGFDSGAAIKIAENLENQSKLSFYLTSSLLISLLTSLTIGAIIYLFFSLFNYSIISPIFVAYVFFYTVLWAIQYIIFSFIRWKGDARTAAFILFSGNTLGVVLGFLFLYFSTDANIFRFFQGLITGYFIGALISVLIAWKDISFKLPDNYRSEFTDLLKLSLPFVGTSFANQLFKTTDRLIIIALFSEYHLGLYALVVRLAQIPNLGLQLIASGFQPVLFSNYKTQSGEKLIKNIFHFLVLAFFPIVLAAIFLAKPLVILFGGGEFAQVAYLFPVIIASVLIYGSTFFNGYGFFIKRKTIQITYITLGVVAGTFLMSYFFVSFAQMGLLGVAMGGLIAAIFGALLYTLKSEKLYSFNYNLKLVLLTYVGIILLALGGSYFIYS